MTAHENFPDVAQINVLARAASVLGYEIVDVSGFLDLVEAHANEQRNALNTLEEGAIDIGQANATVQSAVTDLGESATRVSGDMINSAQLVRELGQNSRQVAAWVQDLSERSEDIGGTLKAVKSNNSQIAEIAMQVNTLAINAKIEAARAGESGKGFAVVAEAINELSQKTSQAAEQISNNIVTLTNWIAELGHEARDVAQSASEVMQQSADTDTALGRMEDSVKDTVHQSTHINEQSATVRTSVEQFSGGMKGIEASISATTEGIKEAHQRIEKLIDTSEQMVQSSAALGAMTDDARFIEYAQNRAGKISEAFEAAIANGRIKERDLFDRTYIELPGTNPQQFSTPSVNLCDHVLPPIQEPALAFNDKVVFCAAVDVNGYLPTHNLKFSQPSRDDVVWNTAHCRNRRIFNDRVGLKSGQNTAPFLLQVYRRDMGGGEYKMMKDLSAPIMVGDRHWGNVRLAYTF